MSYLINKKEIPVKNNPASKLNLIVTRDKSGNYYLGTQRNRGFGIGEKGLLKLLESHQSNEDLVLSQPFRYIGVFVYDSKGEENPFDIVAIITQDDIIKNDLFKEAIDSNRLLICFESSPKWHVLPKIDMVKVVNIINQCEGLVNGDTTEYGKPIINELSKRIIFILEHKNK